MPGFIYATEKKFFFVFFTLNDFVEHVHAQKFKLL